MTNLLRTGAAWLASQLQTHASEPVTYRRGEQSLPLTATRGKNQFPQLGQEQFDVAAKQMDWVFPAADLNFGSGVTLPAVGDEIVAEGVTYEVAKPAPGEQHFDWADPYRISVRVHTQQVSA